MVVYSTAMLVARGLKHGNTFLCMFYFAFAFFVYLVSSFRYSFSLDYITLGLRLWSELVGVVFWQSRLCLLHENDNRLLLEMASIFKNGTDRLQKGKLHSRNYLHQPERLEITFRTHSSRDPIEIAVVFF